MENTSDIFVENETNFRPETSPEESEESSSPLSFTLRRNTFLESPPRQARTSDLVAPASIAAAQESLFPESISDWRRFLASGLAAAAEALPSETSTSTSTSTSMTLDTFVRISSDEELAAFLYEALDFDGSGFVPASQESIKGLESIRVEDTEKECAVCLEDIPVGSEATLLPCSHRFHGDCISKWLRTSKSCPLCRSQLPS